MIHGTILERIKDKYGTDELVKRVENTIRRYPNHAVNLINDMGVSFSTYFLIIPLIKKYNLLKHMNLRNKIAMKLYDECFSDNVVDVTYSDSNEKSVLRWMVNSASYDDGIDDDFDKLIDFAIAKLLSEYNDDETLKNAIDLAFLRNRKKEFTHDLVWEIFKSNNPKALKLIAQHLKSNDEREKMFSWTLIENAVETNIEYKDYTYENVNKWLNDNLPYIEFTGNSYNYSSVPHFCEIHQEMMDKEDNKTASEIKNDIANIINNDYNQANMSPELNAVSKPYSNKKLDESKVDDADIWWEKVKNDVNRYFGNMGNHMGV